jgi:hypothetical protein
MDPTALIFRLLHVKKSCEIWTNSLHFMNYLPNYGFTALVDLGRFFSFLILYTVCRNPWTGDQPFSRQQPTHITTQTRNKSMQIFMPWVRFEPTTPVFEREKMVHALDRAATVIGISGTSLV